VGVGGVVVGVGMGGVCITAGQVIYASFLLHCHNCLLPPALCRFPGCGQIRTQAKARIERRQEREPSASTATVLPFLGVLDLSLLPESADMPGMYIYIHTYTHIYTHTYTHIYTHTYTHTHI
jgi:hypothetical protein